MDYTTCANRMHSVAANSLRPILTTTHVTSIGFLAQAHSSMLYHFFFILFPPPPTSSLMHSPLLSKNPQGLYRSFCVIFSLVKGFAGNMHLFKPNLKIPGKKNKTKKNILRSRLSALSKILWALLDYRICPETGIHATLVACSHCETVSWKTLCHQQQVRSTASLIRIGRRRDPILLHRIHDVQEGTLT